METVPVYNVRDVTMPLLARAPMTSFVKDFLGNPLSHSSTPLTVASLFHPQYQEQTEKPKYMAVRD